MDSKCNIQTIKSATITLLNCNDDFLLKKQSVEQLYEVFKSITGISVEDSLDKDIMLPSGKAISPSSAAHCLLEMKRTTIFLRGIRYRFKGSEPVVEATGRKTTNHPILFDGENKHNRLNILSSKGENPKPFFGQVSTIGERTNKTDGKFSSSGENFKNTPIEFPQPGTV